VIALGVAGVVAVVLVIVMLISGHGPGRHLQHTSGLPGTSAERLG